MVGLVHGEQAAARRLLVLAGQFVLRLAKKAACSCCTCAKKSSSMRCRKNRLTATAANATSVVSVK